jgi:hypothetical protein
MKTIEEIQEKITELTQSITAKAEEHDNNIKQEKKELLLEELIHLVERREALYWVMGIRKTLN